ncbi:MAG: L,D-transpeptidase [Candidatus Saccharimonadales bacterium]
MRPPTVRKKHRSHALFVLILVILVGAVLFWWTQGTSSKQSLVVDQAKAAKTTTKSAPNPCANNTLSQNIIVSISARHLWACSINKSLYSSPVVTGMENLAADLTPTGTYRIYAKETDVHLIGSDSTGSWNDFVYYWMPFLDNQYGAYGFHDATWRSATAFGNISPYSPDASHGCVECPLATAQWLYSWSSVGTTVTVES